MRSRKLAALLVVFSVGEAAAQTTTQTPQQAFRQPYPAGEVSILSKGNEYWFELGKKLRDREPRYDIGALIRSIKR